MLRTWLKYRPRGLGIMPRKTYNRDFAHDQVLLCDAGNVAEARAKMLDAYQRPSGMA